MKRLSEIVSEDCIKVPMVGTTRDDVIRELIELLAIKDIFSDKQAIYKAVLERERIMTTGVGNGIAIPHCKHEDCSDFALAIGIADEDIEFQAVDQKPVRIVFLLVGPTTAAGMHIKVLSRITRIMSKPEVRDRFTGIRNRKEFYQILLEEESNEFS